MKPLKKILLKQDRNHSFTIPATIIILGQGILETGEIC